MVLKQLSSLSSYGPRQLSSLSSYGPQWQYRRKGSLQPSSQTRRAHDLCYELHRRAHGLRWDVRPAMRHYYYYMNYYYYYYYINDYYYYYYINDYYYYYCYYGRATGHASGMRLLGMHATRARHALDML